MRNRKSYVVENEHGYLFVIKSAKPLRNSICEIDKNLIGKKFKIIDFQPHDPDTGLAKVNADRSPVFVKKAVLDVKAEAAVTVKRIKDDADNKDQETKRDKRIGKLNHALKNIDEIADDPVKMKELLRHLIIDALGAREE